MKITDFILDENKNDLPSNRSHFLLYDLNMPEGIFSALKSIVRIKFPPFRPLPVHFVGKAAKIIHMN